MASLLGHAQTMPKVRQHQSAAEYLFRGGCPVVDLMAISVDVDVVLAAIQSLFPAQP
jgi:hypothetical protein